MLTEEYEFDLNRFCCLCHRVSMCECILSGVCCRDWMDRVQVMMNMMMMSLREATRRVKAVPIPRGPRHRSADDTSFDKLNVSITYV
jgi:hypothetical protein